jgi:cell division septation protein DedD
VKAKTGTHKHAGQDAAAGQGADRPPLTAGNITSAPGVVFRIQLGAFKRRISPGTFSDAGNVLELTTQDGLFKYFTGSFSTFDEAAKYKIEMISKGYEGSFIAAFKNGNRVALTDVGAIPAPKRNPNDSDNVKAPAVQKDQIVFKVQIGAFKSEPPADIKAQFSTLKDVKQSTTSSGLNRYTAGSFSNYSEAQKLKEELKKKGIEGAFVIAFFKNELISVPEALELLKQ